MGDHAISRMSVKPLSPLRAHQYSIPGDTTSSWTGYQPQLHREVTAAMAERNNAEEHTATGLTRRPYLSAIPLGVLASSVAPVVAIPEGPGAWARHKGPFGDGDFADLKKTASGLQYLVVEEG